MKRKTYFIALMFIVVVMPDTVSAVLVNFSFTDDYIIENWEPDGGEVLPSETFGILFYAPEDYDFTVEEMSTNVPDWLVFYAGDIPLYFGYQGTGDNPFLPGSSIALDSEIVGETDYQFNFTLNSISPQFSPGEEIDFPVHLYYEDGAGIAYSEGSMSLVGIPEPATIALLGLGSILLLQRRRKNKSFF